MTQIERRAFAVTRPTAEARAADGATGDKLAGYAIVFNADSHDLGGFIERVAPTALTRSLDAATAGTLNIHGLWSHDSSQPLGSTRGGKLALSADDTGLSFELDTTRFTPAQLDAARDGDLQMSFGFIVRQDSWVQRDDGVYERTLIDVDLFEVSPVISPAYPDTTAALRSLDAWKVEARAETPAEAVAEVAEEEPKENVALKIKRELIKKAIEQHLKALPQGQ
jgi:HK97 family phage prohead protease